MKRLLFALLVGATPALADDADPFTPAQHYEIGQKLIHCSAYFRMGAETARRVGMTHNVTAFEDNERGWSLAGMFMLVDGLSLDRQTETKTIAKNMSDSKLTDLMARKELYGDSAGEEFASLFAQECQPLRELQKTLVRVMRAGQ